jgi:hypothetical protein
MKTILALLVVALLVVLCFAGELSVATVAKPYDKTDLNKKVTLQESPRENCWRLIHDGKKVIALWEGEGVTWTGNQLYCASKLEEVEAKIKDLNLEPLKEIETP